MAPVSEQELVDNHQKLASDVAYLADEIKLLAINLAIALARLHERNVNLNMLRDRFTELIGKATDASDEVQEVIKAFQAQRQMVYQMPSSDLVEQQRGAYDRLEMALNEIYGLSQKLIESINIIRDDQK